MKAFPYGIRATKFQEIIEHFVCVDFRDTPTDLLAYLQKNCFDTKTIQVKQQDIEMIRLLEYRLNKIKVIYVIFFFFVFVFFISVVAKKKKNDR